MNRDILVLGYGNPGRGDDALGPLLIEKLDHAGGAKHESLVCFQLQPEQIFDLENRRLVLFADASLSTPGPFGFSELSANCEISYSTHSMSPNALLYVYETLLQRPPPPCFLLSIRGERFGLGEELGGTAKRNLDAAFVFATGLLEQPEPLHWRERITPALQSSSSESPRGSSRWNARDRHQTPPARTPSGADR